MRSDIKARLQDTTPEQVRPLDVDGLVRRGQRRRLAARVGRSGLLVAVVGVVVGLVGVPGQQLRISDGPVGEGAPKDSAQQSDDAVASASPDAGGGGPDAAGWTQLPAPGLDATGPLLTAGRLSTGGVAVVRAAGPDSDQLEAAIHDPETRAWRPVPELPFELGDAPAWQQVGAETTGGTLAIWLSHGGPVDRLDGPRAREWQRLSREVQQLITEAPGGPSTLPPEDRVRRRELEDRMAELGSELAGDTITTLPDPDSTHGGMLVEVDDTAPWLGAVYDPQADTWTPVPTPSFADDGGEAVAHAHAHVVAGSTVIATEESAEAPAALHRWTEGEGWQRLERPDVVDGTPQLHPLGDGSIGVTGADTGAAVLDVTTGRWTTLPTPPVPARQLARAGDSYVVSASDDSGPGTGMERLRVYRLEGGAWSEVDLPEAERAVATPAGMLALTWDREPADAVPGVGRGWLLTDAGWERLAPPVGLEDQFWPQLRPDGALTVNLQRPVGDTARDVQVWVRPLP